MAHDYDTVRHSMNVSVFAVGLAHAAGVRTATELQELALGTLLHDIGKSELPRELAVAQHHERLTGTGYPGRLSGTNLHLFGRITAIEDCFDAMTSDRSYQHAMRPADALHLMRTQLASHFDQALLGQFIRTLRVPR